MKNLKLWLSACGRLAFSVMMFCLLVVGCAPTTDCDLPTPPPGASSVEWVRYYNQLAKAGECSPTYGEIPITFTPTPTTTPEPVTSVPTVVPTPAPTETPEVTLPPTPHSSDVDNDGDGVTENQGDCDDANNNVYPNATEICDGVDNDCDPQTAYGIYGEDNDVDGDGFTNCMGDCQEGDPASYPDAPELCDHKDNDCDGLKDEGFTPESYQDADEDGYAVCEGDCNDSNPYVHPGFGSDDPGYNDGLDNDCDGQVDEDNDADGDGYAPATGDCDDSNSTIYPSAPELCDNVDNDCEGTTDENPDQGGQPLYLDFDADGVGGDQVINPNACYVELPVGGIQLSFVTGDCDDSDETIYPGAPELCDIEDNDCDGQVDEDTDLDGDGDGLSACEGDCNDINVNTYPGATEICDGIDNDCDGSPFFDEEDDDRDGISECNGDCDDNTDSVYPGAEEICDGADNDCDGQLSEVEVDNDSDGYAVCQGDCDDTADHAYPGYPEYADGADNDCDGQIDEEETPSPTPAATEAPTQVPTPGPTDYTSTPEPTQVPTPDGTPDVTSAPTQVPTPCVFETFEDYAVGPAVTDFGGFSVTLLAGATLDFGNFGNGDIALCGADGGQVVRIQFDLDVQTNFFGLTPYSLDADAQLCGYSGSQFVQCLPLPKAISDNYIENFFSDDVDRVIFQSTVVDSICTGLVRTCP